MEDVTEMYFLEQKTRSFKIIYLFNKKYVFAIMLLC
jgi:hypothetical protein